MHSKLVRLVVLSFAALMLGALKAPAQGTLNGIDLARACASQAADDQALCRGFIDGFTYGTQLAVGPEFIGQWRYGAQNWCFKSQASTSELRDVFMADAKANSGTLHFPAPIVLANAFAAKYPCR